MAQQRMEVWVGPHGGLKLSAESSAYIQGQLKEKILDALGDLVAQTRGRATIQTVTIDVENSKDSRILGSMAGNYFEYALFEALLKTIGQEASQVDVDRAAIPKTVLSEYGNAGKKLMEQCHQVAAYVAPIIHKEWGFTEAQLKEELSVEWLGGSGSIGDLKVTLAGRTLMIECKNYKESTIANYGLTYFTLSDAKDNFPSKFYDYLYPSPKKHGNLSTDKWMNYVLNDGFKKWTSSFASPNTAKNQLMYFIQKGSHASQEVDQRAIVVLERMTGGKNITVSVNFDLEQLVKEITVRRQYSSARIDFQSKKEPIAFVEIANLKDIKANSKFENPEADGKGWTTVLHMGLNKAFLNRMNQYTLK